MATNLFISWSGALSQAVAGIVHTWIPSVLQSVEPFLSSEDIEKGTRWSDHIAQKLEECGFGIILLTGENAQAPWIMFESGALSKMVGKSNVAPILIDMKLTDVRPPLSQFQAVVFSEKDILRLLKSINKVGESPVKEDALERTFAAMWPSFKNDIDTLISSKPKAGIKDKEDMGETSPIESLSLSVSELIKTVQAMRDEVRSSSTDSLKEDLERAVWELRRSTRSSGIPMGAVKDLEFCVHLIESAIKDSKSQRVILSKENSDQLNLRLNRATSYIIEKVNPRRLIGSSRTD